MAENIYRADEEIEEEIEEEEEEEEQQIETWDDWGTDEEDSEPDLLCLFCDRRFGSVELLFVHCESNHSFDFPGLRKDLLLDFYGCFKLINYVRSQVEENKCWNCGLAFRSNNELLDHLHPVNAVGEEIKLLWEDETYLKPFIVNDALLHSFYDDGDDDDNNDCTVDREEVMRELMDFEDPHVILVDEDNMSKPLMDGLLNTVDHVDNGVDAKENCGALKQKGRNKHLRVSFANVAAREIKNVNDSYFGAYGSFGIHKEMISDKVRTDAYRDAITKNPSLLKHATVLDVGCGTGILSLFAAQAGALRVIAVEASEKMASVATQIAKDNGLLLEGNQTGDMEQTTGVISVVHGMVEELDNTIQVPPHSVDVLLSEWMGYCLLYESMLSSILYARDRWLKPGGAILPDTATIFVAGFGRGGTSVPFWENVYGFDMSCIGKEVVEDASQNPIVDVVGSRDIVTDAVIIQTFDLVTMNQDEMDFTSTFELRLKSDSEPQTTQCCGIVLWFETAFTRRFCKETPTVLSTSPYGPKTHWSQTIFTFREPITMTSLKSSTDKAAPVGTAGCPIMKLESRISIARSSQHRSIDISLETSGIGLDGRNRRWPVQIFNL